MKSLRRVVVNESYFDYYDFDQSLSDEEACEQVWNDIMHGRREEPSKVGTCDIRVVDIACESDPYD